MHFAVFVKKDSWVDSIWDIIRVIVTIIKKPSVTDSFYNAILNQFIKIQIRVVPPGIAGAVAIIFTVCGKAGIDDSVHIAVRSLNIF